MTLMELKDLITQGIMPTDFMIFVCKDNHFLAKQYTEALGKLATNVQKIKSIYEPQQSTLTLLAAPEGTLNIMKVETFDERAEDYSQFENTIVVCDQVEKTLIKNVEKYVINMPKFEEWQIFDYSKKLCPSVNETNLTWLIQASGNCIERVINEIDKIKYFDKETADAMLLRLRLMDTQSDLYNPNIFDIVNALIDGDMPVLSNFINRDGHNRLEPVMLANRALTSIKNILIVTQNPNLTAEDCGVSFAQYKALKYKYRSLNVTAAKEKLKFLANFDLMLKTSKLDLSKRDMLSYLVNNLSYKITL